jgi:hypothetical protein
MPAAHSASMLGRAHRAPASPRRVHAPGNEVLPSTGAALDPPARALFEARFGRDLAAVRVHTGPGAALAAAARDAEAFTVGRDIVLGAGAPDVSTAAGGSLLAHELAHVLQQPASRGGTHAGELERAGEQAAERDAGAGARSALTSSARSWQPSRVPVSVLRQRRSPSRPATLARGRAWTSSSS